jgi:hypothetical protein
MLPGQPPASPDRYRQRWLLLLATGAALREALSPSRRLSSSGGRLGRHPASKVSSQGQDQRADAQSEEHNAQKECE